MKLNIILLFIATIFAQNLFSQDKPKLGWQREMVGGINLTQTSFDNWIQGGENSTSWQINLNMKFINEQEKSTWSNSGKFTYGETKTGSLESRKSIDEIKLESVLAYKTGAKLNPYVAATGETQFAAGYNYGPDSKVQISSFMDPGYFRESAGISYQASKVISTRLGAALKQTITSNYPTPFADDPSTAAIEKFKSEFGAESVTDVNWKISANSVLISKLELFSAFKAVDETDVNWDNTFTTKISKYFNVNFNLKLFYDKDISPKRQIKQALAFGLSYSFL